MTATTAQAWYLYGVLPAAMPAPPVGGVLPGAAVEAIALGAVTVLASLVPRALFDRDSAASRTGDPDWMALCLAAHHGVNAAASEAGPCLPLAFGALFTSLERLAAWLAPREATLLAALARVAEQSEWALSLLEDRAAHDAWLDAHDATLAALCAAAAGAGEGTRFLLARRLERARAGVRAAHLDRVAAELAARLRACGLEVLAEPPRAGLPAWTLLAAVCTPCGPSLPTRVAPLADALAPCGLALRLAGPWPPYATARAAFAAEVRHG